MKPLETALTVCMAVLAAAAMPACGCSEDEPPLIPDISVSGGKTDRASLSSVTGSGITIMWAAAAEIDVQPTIDGRPTQQDSEVTATADNSAVVRVYKTKDPLTFVLAAISIGNANLVLTWKGKVEKRIPVVVAGQ